MYRAKVFNHDIMQTFFSYYNHTYTVCCGKCLKDRVQWSCKTYFFKMTICQKLQTCLTYKTGIMLQALWILVTSKKLYDILYICRFLVLYVHYNNEHHRQNSQNKRHWHNRYSMYNRTQHEQIEHYRKQQKQHTSK